MTSPDAPRGPGRTRGLSRRSFSLRTARQDLQAGLVNAVVSVPDGLAAAALAGVNPVYGLYTSATAPVTGSALASSHLMQIATTSASALAAGQAVAAYPAAERDDAMFLLVVLSGMFLALFGILRLGRCALRLPRSDDRVPVRGLGGAGPGPARAARRVHT